MSSDQALAAHFGAAGPRRLGIALSGGGDSTALTLLAHDWAQISGSELFAATVDHGLRPEAAAEAEAAGRFCASLGIPHDILRWQGWDGQGNLMAEARAARYRLLAGWAGTRRLADIALGHTRDDNIETFAMALARGTGLDGLAGMRARFVRPRESDGPAMTFHRPLLAVSRAALRDLLSARGVGWIDDPSNEDSHFERVRMRKALAGALAAAGIGEAQVARSIAHLAATAADLAAELRVRLEGERGVWTDGPDLVFDLGLWQGLTGEFRRRSLSAALRFVGGDDTPPRAEALMRLVGRNWTAEPGPATLAGCLITATGAELRISREYAAVAGLTAPSTGLWDRRWRVSGPHGAGTELRALGPEGLAQIGEDWRLAALPRRALLAAPAIWQGERLLSAPFVPGFSGAWRLSAGNEIARLWALLGAG